MREIGYTSFLHCISNFEGSSILQSFLRYSPISFIFCMFCINFWIRRYHFHNLLEFHLTLWAIPEKNNRFEEKLFWKPLWNFWIFYFTPGNSRQNKALPQPRNSTKLCYIPWNLSWSMSIKSWKIHLLFLLNTPGNSIYLTPYYSA